MRICCALDCRSECGTCLLKADSCTSCASGFHLYHNKCFGKRRNNFKISRVLDTQKINLSLWGDGVTPILGP